MKIFDKRINEIQKDEDEYFVYLKYGFQIQEGLHHSPVHCFGERTIRNIKETMKHVTICRCDECVKHITN
ncbi:MAG: hypothetical protein COA54_03340 [Thiotrichaceae bacterium]|nr:MAG: hypothetical protein COA54_03340 [Thiotrichaceae bacterium]